MTVTRLTQRILLAVVCCLAIIFLPLSAGAQGGVLKKGAEGVQKGVETGAEKTKEGAEAVGHGVKDAVTGEDTDTTRMKSTETTEPSQATPPSTTAPSSTSTRSETTTSSQTTTGETGSKSTPSERAKAGGERLPATAGELPSLALIGIFALAASGTSRFIRRAKVER